MLSRLQDESDELTVLALTPEETALYTNAYPFGPAVSKQLPITNQDLKCATECLAIGQPTAAAYHLGRAVEAALDTLADNLGMHRTPDASMGRTIAECRAQMEKWREQKDERWTSNAPFLIEALSHLKAFQTAWRDPTAHPGTFYDQDKADQIWHIARGLLQHIAEHVNETTNR